MRPGHIDKALMTLREVALAHKSVLTCGELLEISHYVARLERRLANAQKPSRWARAKVWWRERWNAGAAARRRMRA